MRLLKALSNLIRFGLGPRLIVDMPDLRVWSNGARDVLLERRSDGTEVWKLYRDVDDDSIMETLIVERRPLKK